MRSTPKKQLGRSLSVLLILALCLSLFVFPASAVEFADMNPVDDPLLGESFEVDAVIPLASSAEGLNYQLFVPVDSMTADELAAAIEAGSLTVSLDRDASRPYLNDVLYPNQSQGGALGSWQAQNRQPMFTDISLSDCFEGEQLGVLVSFHAGNYFYSRNNPDFSAPHANGGAYMDVCGYFNLNVSSGDAVLGSAPVKVAPYFTFHTMAEIYKDLEEIAAVGAENGLYANLFSLGSSTSGRDMPCLIVADEQASVEAWLDFAELAETNPEAALVGLEAGDYDDLRVPVLYSNVHANEVAAADGVMRFADMIVREESIPYKTLSGFTAAGEEELAAEMGPKGGKNSLAVPDLIADKATYLGYITADNHGQSGAVDLETYYEIEDHEVSVSELLKDVFFILVPEENVDGRTFITRTSSNGYDLNRDNSFQTTPETANMQKLIGSFNPVSFTEFHGRVTAFQCEPCDPPHEPNFEYDLLAEHLVTGGEAFGIAAVANNDGYNSYVMPQRDYLVYTGNGDETLWADPWDDMSTSYTPQFAMLHGTVAYTVELPAYNDHTTQAVQYGCLGQAVYVAGEKLEYVKAQTTGYLRGVTNANSDAYELVGQWFCDQNDVEGAEMELFRPEFNGEGENGNFYPECYIIPLDAALQSNLQAAVDMAVWLTRNDAKVIVTDKAFTYEGVEYPAGTLIVSMYQAKRSVANGALYDGTLINSWTVLYSEGITSFNETRGFDMITVTKPAEYEKITEAFGEVMDYEAALDFAAAFTGSFSGVEDMDVIISNASEASASAVNALLDAGCKVGMVTEGEYKGDFICSYADYLTIADAFIITATGIDAADIKASLIAEVPAVFVPGASNLSASGCVYYPQASNASWNYDMAAMRMMGFTVVENVADANVLAGCASAGGAALEAVKAGLPAIVYGRSAVNALKIPGLTYTGLSGAMDCLAYVSYPVETLVNASYIADGDDVLYGYGFGFFGAVPEAADILVATEAGKTPTEGFIPTNSAQKQAAFETFLNGAALGIAYAEDGMNVVCFANTLTNKLHQRDEYSFISNFIFSSLLGDEYTPAEKPEPPRAIPALRTYVITAEAGEGGAISPEGKVIVNELSSKTFTVTAEEGYELKQLLVDGVSVAPADSYSFDRISIGHSIKAVFGKQGEEEEKPVMNFIDVDENDWFYDAVAFAVENGIMNGMTENEFAPDTSATRAMIAMMLYRLEGCPEVTYEMATLHGTAAAKNVPFTDVDANAWYIDAVIWANQNGIVLGYEDGSFKPGKAISREELAVILYRYAQLKGEGFTGAWMFLLPFTDRADISGWADEAVHWCYMNGVINGRTETAFVPGDTATRAETAAMFQRFCEVLG